MPSHSCEHSKLTSATHSRQPTLVFLVPHDMLSRLAQTLSEFLCVCAGDSTGSLFLTLSSPTPRGDSGSTRTMTSQRCKFILKLFLFHLCIRGVQMAATCSTNHHSGAANLCTL